MFKRIQFQYNTVLNSEIKLNKYPYSLACSVDTIKIGLYNTAHIILELWIEFIAIYLKNDRLLLETWNYR